MRKIAADYFRYLHWLTCLSVLVTVLIPTAEAKIGPGSAKGIIKVDGTVTIDRQKVVDGQTIFERATVITERDSESLIVLNNLTRLNLAPETDLTVEFAQTVSAASLRSGRITAFVPAGVALNFQTADLSITSLPNEVIIFTIETRECEGTLLSVEIGQLITSTSGRPQTLKAGESLSTDAGRTANSSLPQHLSGKKKVGIFAAIGGAAAILLAVALGQNDQDQDNPGDFGGQVTVPSPR